jgi:hypothetical protein
VGKNPKSSVMELKPIDSSGMLLLAFNIRGPSVNKREKRNKNIQSDQPA